VSIKIPVYEISYTRNDKDKRVFVIGRDYFQAERNAHTLLSQSSRSFAMITSIIETNTVYNGYIKK